MRRHLIERDTHEWMLRAAREQHDGNLTTLGVLCPEKGCHQPIVPRYRQHRVNQITKRLPCQHYAFESEEALWDYNLSAHGLDRGMLDAVMGRSAGPVEGPDAERAKPY